MKQPLVADIKRNALDDGPGIRTTVFFKGCPLSCVWCHNPECIRAASELMHRAERCIDCGTCRQVCPRGAIGAGGPLALDRQRCDLCDRCVEECPAAALERVGRMRPVDELVAELLRDEPFFRNSGGGVTLSGGEPTLYMEYAGAVARALRERGVDVMIETCGDFDGQQFDQHLRPHLSRIWIDLKLDDPEEHRRYCGRDNARIIDNIVRLARSPAPPILVRVPLIPDITLTEKNLRAIAERLQALGLQEIGVIPYNPLWQPKARGLGLQPGVTRTQGLSRAERELCRRALAGMSIVSGL